MEIWKIKEDHEELRDNGFHHCFICQEKLTQTMFCDDCFSILQATVEQNDPDYEDFAYNLENTQDNESWEEERPWQKTC